MLGRVYVRWFGITKKVLQEEIPDKGIKIASKTDKYGEKTVNADPQKLLRTVYMTQLPYEITKEELSEIFKRYGPLESIHIPKNKGKTHARGDGNIVFSDARNAYRASVQMQGYVLNNKPIKLLLGSSFQKKINEKYDVVMLKNLSYSTEELDIMEILRPYQVLRVGLARSPIKKECLGYGYARFANPDIAAKALDELKNVKVKGRKLRMHFAEKKAHDYKFIV